MCAKTPEQCGANAETYMSLSIILRERMNASSTAEKRKMITIHVVTFFSFVILIRFTPQMRRSLCAYCCPGPLLP